MTEPQPDDGMIEIGDIEAIDDEPVVAPEPPPQVVIEYRDRGIPWMLVPPLLVLVAVVAGVGVYNYNASLKNRRPPPAPVVEAAEVDPSVDDPLPEPIPGYPLTTSRFEGTPPLAPQPEVFENPPTPAPPVVVAPAVTDPAVATDLNPPAPIGAVAEAMPTPTPEPAPSTVITGQMFDPAAFELGANLALNEPGAAPFDQNLAPVSGAEPGGDLDIAPDQPMAIDPNLLPPDPRQARANRLQRAHEAHNRLEQERFDFHAHLSAIYQKYGKRSAPLVAELCQAYGQDIPPAAKDQAIKLLGRGMFAGAALPTRINLLRKLGFPESAILGDIVDVEGKHISPVQRNAPSQEALYLHAVRILLSNPPSRPAATARTGP